MGRRHYSQKPRWVLCVVVSPIHFTKLKTRNPIEWIFSQDCELVIGPSMSMLQGVPFPHFGCMKFCDSFPQPTKGSWNVLWPKFLHKKRPHVKIQCALLDMVVCSKSRNMHGRTNFGVRDPTSSFDGSRIGNLDLTVDLHHTQIPNALDPTA